MRHENLRKLNFFFFALGIFLSLLQVNQAMAQPAPTLTEFRVVGVRSIGYLNASQYDTVPPGASITPNDHRGGGLIVAVFERGYGHLQTASFNGVRMNLVHSEPDIGPGNRIRGYIRYYHSSTNFTSGTFTSSARSINFPFNTMSTRLTIR